MGKKRSEYHISDLLIGILPLGIWIAYFALIACPFADALAFNPFQIDMRDMEGKELTSDDYVEIQKRLRQIDIREFLREKYNSECTSKVFVPCQSFYDRTARSLYQTLIDVEKGLIPQKELVQINKGGNRCVVCSVPFGGKYTYYVNTLVQVLKDTGFNGYFLYFIGGWPNPTGREIRYVSVPYSFKIFAMLEAQTLGFNHVLWIDAACYPLRNIEPLFDIIARNGALLNWFHTPSDSLQHIFPGTKQLLIDLTGVDVLRAKFVNSIVMGIKMDSPEAKRFLQKYYEFAEMGTPFLSWFPEEFVFTAIINDGNYPGWLAASPPRLVQGSAKQADDSPREFDIVRRAGVYFYHRKGR